MKTLFKIEIFLLITFLVFTCFSFGTIKADINDNVSGWIWSDNIGWISLNNITDGSSYNYGVNIDISTGLFSGYAWSDSVGWISFNRSDTGTPPGPPYDGGEDFIACLDFPGVGQDCDGVVDYKVFGWARTVNTGDGWDGWIKLRDDVVYADGVFLNDSTNEFEGWAWSDDFGWISFNCIEDGTCATSDYKAEYSPPPNQPPTCTSLSALPTTGVTPLDVSFTGEGSDSDGTIVQYEFDFGFGEGPPFPFTTFNNTADHTYNSAGTYCAKLRVQDDEGAWSATPGDCPDVCAEEIVVEVNNPPTAVFSCNPDPGTCGTLGCTGYTGCLFRLENQSTDPDSTNPPDNDDDIASSTWTITDAISERLECDPIINPLCDWPLQAYHIAGNYTATLKAEDQAGVENTSLPQNFTILQDAIADFKCSLNSEGPWSDCDGFGLSEGEVIYFNSEDYSSPSEPGSGTSIISWSWTFTDGTPPTGNSQNSSSVFEALNPNSGEITLTIIDTAGRSKTTGPYQLIIKLPLPEWREVSPF